jgi:anthranilate synthase/aminodeoxychorismate synthase-like glutamine amidotransferase
VNVAFIENNDSFSWNVIDLLPVPRNRVTVVSGTDGRAWELVRSAEVIVLGPGPLDPVRTGLVDLTRRIVERGVPLLGICLGHQAIGLALGATLVRTVPTHGKTTPVRFSPSRCFGGIEGTLTAMRYHSLSVTAVKEPLQVIAETPEGLVMAVEHRSLPVAGLQFHPDSHATPEGRRLVECFFGSLP